jgi:hypothetical protein
LLSTTVFLNGSRQINNAREPQVNEYTPELNNSDREIPNSGVFYFLVLLLSSFDSGVLHRQKCFLRQHLFLTTIPLSFKPENKNRHRRIRIMEEKSQNVPYSKRPEWSDVTPIPQEDGPDALVPIAYSDECMLIRTLPILHYSISCFILRMFLLVILMVLY